MGDGPEWFAPRRYGYGAGLPISWQGWAVTVGYVGIVWMMAQLIGRDTLKLVAALLPLTALFLLICARTTRGGWHWRWGDED
ncbi:MAG: hypothetical protein ACM3ZV_00770 [Bacillota bacterium]